MSKNDEILGFPIVERYPKGRRSTRYKIKYKEEEVMLAVFHKRFSRDAQFVNALKKFSLFYAQLRHPNVLKILAWNFEEPCYIIMEIFKGTYPLDARRTVDQRKKTITLLSELFDDLHKKGEFHGNLSAETLFERSNGDICVGGWGGRFFPKLYSGNQIYRAPEESQGSKVSDLYGLGLIGYQLISGQLPWEEKCTPI